jgi:hypothetical protein
MRQQLPPAVLALVRLLSGGSGGYSNKSHSCTDVLKCQTDLNRRVPASSKLEHAYNKAGLLINTKTIICMGNRCDSAISREMQSLI